jgi:hypothetical protein
VTVLKISHFPMPLINWTEGFDGIFGIVKEHGKKRMEQMRY